MRVERVRHKQTAYLKGNQSFTSVFKTSHFCNKRIPSRIRDTVTSGALCFHLDFLRGGIRAVIQIVCSIVLDVRSNLMEHIPFKG